MNVGILNGPPHYATLVEGCPETISFTRSSNCADAVHLFITEAKELKVITSHTLAMPPVTMLWVSWPKLTSKLSKGLREDDIRKAALARGLVDIKVCAVDADWSGLKLVRRKAS